MRKKSPAVEGSLAAVCKDCTAILRDEHTVFSTLAPCETVPHGCSMV